MSTEIKGSALEWASVQDVLQISGIISEEENEFGQDLLIRTVYVKIDYDCDYDFDSEEF